MYFRYPGESVQPPSALDQFIKHANANAAPSDRRNGQLPPADASSEGDRMPRRSRANSGAMLPPAAGDGSLPLPPNSGMHSPRNGPLPSPHHATHRTRHIDQRAPPGLGTGPIPPYASRPLPPYDSRDSRRLSEAQHLKYMRDRMPRQQEHRHSLPLSPPGIGRSQRLPADAMFAAPMPGVGPPRKAPGPGAAASGGPPLDATADYRRVVPSPLPNQGQGRGPQ